MKHVSPVTNIIPIENLDGADGQASSRQKQITWRTNNLAWTGKHSGLVAIDSRRKRSSISTYDTRTRRSWLLDDRQRLGDTHEEVEYEAAFAQHEVCRASRVLSKLHQASDAIVFRRRCYNSSPTAEHKQMTWRCDNRQRVGDACDKDAFGQRRDGELCKSCRGFSTPSDTKARYCGRSPAEVVDTTTG